MKHILLVDDERPVMDRLRLRLRGMQRQWQIDFAESGHAAIERMGRQLYDVIVTDMRMPQMNGAQLLEVVSTRWPQTIRIVLSGHSDSQDSSRAVSLAHQFLNKPCEAKLLESVIQRCLLLHDLLHGSQVPVLVGRIRNLPAVPRIYAKLQAMVKDDSVTVKDVARLISTDSAISAKILHIVNSAFFRLARQVANIEQAVSYLGFATIRNIAMSVEIFSQWSATGTGPIDPERLQLHAQQVSAGSPRKPTSRYTRPRPGYLAPRTPRSVRTSWAFGAFLTRWSKQSLTITLPKEWHQPPLTYWVRWQWLTR